MIERECGVMANWDIVEQMVATFNGVVRSTGSVLMLLVPFIRKKTGLRPMRQTPQDAWDSQDTNLQSGHPRSDAIVGDTSTNVC